jgi:hypothetical protein
MARQSPQSKWAKKKKGQGRCSRCGQPRNRYRQLCDAHQTAFNAYMRAWRASRKAAKAVRDDN